jgi:hypothetical protein
MKDRGWTWCALGLALALLWMPSRALAHDGPHKGASVQGTVVSVADDTLRVKGERGEIAVTLSARTQVRSGSQVVGREALQPGVRVDVHGSKLPGGGFAAREVVIESAPREGSSQSGGKERR